MIHILNGITLAGICAINVYLFVEKKDSLFAAIAAATCIFSLVSFMAALISSRKG